MMSKSTVVIVALTLGDKIRADEIRAGLPDRGVSARWMRDGIRIDPSGNCN
jgi:hypothetical protein